MASQTNVMRGVQLWFKVPIAELTADLSDCQALEKEKKLGLCTLIDTEEAKIKKSDTYPQVARLEKRTYACQAPLEQNETNCDALKTKGCESIGSKCIFKKNNKCYKWQQTYECLTQQATKEPKYKLVCGDNTFCLEGDCVQSNSEKNSEMLEAVSQLEALKAALGDAFKPAGGTISNIFGGKPRGCKIYSIARNCCDMKGWLKKNCDKESKEANDMRKAGLCHEVGTYYVEKSILKDRRKKTNYCCFNSKLARVIHEQGRSQLGLGWGDPESPMCRGLTPNEIAQIDFSRMDFSFLYQDIAKRQKQKDLSHLKKTIQARMKLIQKGLKQPGDRGADE